MAQRGANEDLQHASVAEVLVAFPGEDAADANLVESAVKEINETWRIGGLETARKIGEIVTKRFFDGDVANAHSRKRTHKSYQALASHKGLKMAASNLWYCVAVYEHFGVLPVSVAEGLTVEHHRVLSHVKDVSQRIVLATLAVDKYLTASELKSAIAEKKVTNPNAKKRGRPPLLPVVKKINLANKVLVDLKNWDAIRFSAMDKREREYAIAEARLFADAVADWMASISATLSPTKDA